MKIAQVAPIEESVPPKLYGGSERVVSYLTEELVRQNHDVTLFASGDSTTSANLVSVVDRGLRLNHSDDSFAYHILLLEEVCKRAKEFDIIHFHIDYLHYPVSRRMQYPQLTTLHGRLDIPSLRDIYHEYNDMPVVSISNNQRLPLPGANWLSTIYNGIPEENYSLSESAGEYLAFLGRISPEKGIETAIEIAIRSDMPLKIAAKIDKVDHAYFNTHVRPLLQHPLIEYIGEINDSEKNSFLRKASALLFPIDWPEPFGLVMIEAMACGTPTIAYLRGSVPEIINNGETGYIVSNVEQAKNAVLSIDNISRQRCRQVFETNYSSRIMTQNYINTYNCILETSFQKNMAV